MKVSSITWFNSNFNFQERVIFTYLSLLFRYDFYYCYDPLLRRIFFDKTYYMYSSFIFFFSFSSSLSENKLKVSRKAMCSIDNFGSMSYFLRRAQLWQRNYATNTFSMYEKSFILCDDDIKTGAGFALMVYILRRAEVFSFIYHKIIIIFINHYYLLGTFMYVYCVCICRYVSEVIWFLLLYNSPKSL